MSALRKIIAASLDAAGIVAKAKIPGKTDGHKSKPIRSEARVPSTIKEWRIADHAVEYLEANLRLLADPYGRSEAEQVRAIDAAKRRARMARLYRDLKEGGAVSPMRSVDLTNDGGRAGFAGRQPGDHVIDCIKQVNDIEALLPLTTRGILENCLVAGTLKISDEIMDSLKFGLDIVALERLEMGTAEFESRWPGLIRYLRA